MNTLNHNLESAHRASRMDEWVLESCFLDLLVDEEDPKDLDNWAREQGWSAIFTRARGRIQNAGRGDKDDTYWPFTDSVVIPELIKSKNHTGVADRFLKMKAARAQATLDCNQKRRDYAESLSPDENGRESVRKGIEVLNSTLDSINLDCLGAFGLIHRVSELVEQDERRVLAALFHSEACASGTTADVSYGMARAFEKLFFSKNHRWTWLFRLISTNNQGRGLNHQRNYNDCIRLLVQYLEKDFAKDFDTIEEKYRPLVLRLVFFPRVFILAESLQECHRKAEAAWWLKQARDKEPKPSPYWRSRIEVELSNIESLEGEETFPQPKLMNENQKRVYLNKERLIAKDEKPKDIDDCTSKWSRALAWSIRWHEGDPVNLPGTIQGSAQSIQTVSEALKNHYKQKSEKGTPDVNIFMSCLRNVNEVLETLQKAIQSYPKDRVFQFLSPENQSADLELELGDAIKTWNALKRLMPALKAAIEFQKGLEAQPNVDESCPSLLPWSERLKERLLEAWKKKCFEYVAYYQHVFELLQNPEKLCPNSERERSKDCENNPNCAEETLQLGGSSGKSCVASTKYLLTRMSRFEAEFTRFLKEPSLKYIYDSRKEQKIPVTPLIEFVSLKRWSSFSPNLASHGTTTVGGGYLVRVWDKSSETYVGIAIDPGYNYLENLFDEGFTLPDLHVIAITHAHPDHVENLSNILTLLREREKRIRTTSRVFLVLTEGVFQRFKTLIDNEIDYIHDVIVLSWDRPERDMVNVVRSGGQGSNRGPISLTVSGSNNPDKIVVPPIASIKAVRAIHADGTDFDSMGMVIRVVDQEGDGESKVGFTGDTRYSSRLSTGEFANCKVLVPHLGSIIKSDAFSNSHESCSPDLDEEIKNRALRALQPTLTEKNHLYLPGISMLMCDVKKALGQLRPPLIILSEFGEELRGGLRVDLASRLQHVFKVTVLPADVGLRVGVKDQSVRCAICRQYVHAAAVRPIAVSDEDEALLFVCKDCYRARQHELPALLERLRKTPQELYRNSKGEREVSRKSEDGKE